VKAACYYKPGDVRVEEMARPEPGPGEILLRVLSCGLCGTDLAKYRHRLVPPGTVLGHEVAGEIAAVGEDVTAFKPGDRVISLHHIPCFACAACRHKNYSMCASWKPNQFSPGGFAEYVRIGARAVQHGVRLIPVRLDPDTATLVEPLACCLRGFRRSPIMPGDTVVVIGAGTAGLLHVQLARFHGAGRVISIDLMPERLQKALTLGADAVINANEQDPADGVRKATHGAGADLIITAVGNPKVVEQALGMARDGGRVNVFAECPPDSRIAIDPNLMYRREVILMGSYSSSPYEFTDALWMIESGRIGAGELISHRMPLEQLQHAMEMAVGAENCLKIIIKPNQ